jgi:3-deoxy-D-manno-octulosonate 8-phosphate phosphatase (KDO 8-P phosphatase)
MTPTLATACAALPPEGAFASSAGRAALTPTPASAVLAPALSFAPELLLRAQGIRVAFFDVDGVLTDGGLYFSDRGETLKRFHTLDGHGLKLLPMADITPAVITGRDSKPLRARLQALGITHVHYGAKDKSAAAAATLRALGLDWAQAAAIGDDWPDLPVLRRCAFAAAPPNAHIEVRAAAHYVTRARGGAGAAREFCDLLLIAAGRYAALLASPEPSP